MTDLTTALERTAEKVRCELQAQDDAWGTSGWTRRRFLAGVGMAGAAALGSQLVTARAAYSATPSTDDRTLVMVFLRGAADGLRVLVPNAPSLGLDYLNQVRPRLVPTSGKLIALPGQNGWAVNSALQPLYDGLWSTGELTFVPAVSTPGISRSHFQAQQYLERGGAETASTGWLDRLLDGLGVGTTFRTVALGDAMPQSLTGSTSAVTLSNLADFTFPGWSGLIDASRTAVDTLYRGLDSSLSEDVRTTLAAVDTAKSISGQLASSGYASNDFAQSLRNLAAILKAEVGMQVATVDVGGWDTHTDEVGDLDNNLASVATALRAFMDDLGPDRRTRVTVVLQTEFGRRIAMNDSGGTDHGHGSVMWLLGGGLSGSGVKGRWTQLSSSNTDQGDVMGLNNPFDVLTEIAQKRLGAGSMGKVFPGRTATSLGLASAG